MKSKKQKNNIKAFTIVELLIVIVIIGILAVITIVSYTGITSRANQTTIISDLTTAKNQFELYKVDHGAYPTGIENGTNCLTGTISPSPDTRYCLKSTTGSAYTLEDATGSDYTLKLTKGTVAYKVTKDLAPTSTTAAVAAASFVKTWGGASDEYSQSITRTNDGGYAITGHTTSYGAGSYDMFISKYDASGALSWNRIWGGSNTDYGYDIIQSSDGGYAITGQTNSYGSGSYDLILVKFDSNGNLLWNKLWGGSGSDEGYSIAQTNDGGYIVTGETTSYGAGSYDFILVKFDSNGNLSWNKTWGGSGPEAGIDVIQISDGGYVISGNANGYGAGVNDMLLIKYDVNGNLLWNKLWGGAGDDYGRGIIQTSDGGYIVAGYSGSYGAGAYDILSAKYDANGNLMWNKLWGGASNDAILIGQTIVKSSDGGYTIAGYTASYGAGNNDMAIIKYDNGGNLIWNKLWGGVGNDRGYSLSQSNDSGYIVSGATSSYGVAGDVFVAKLNSSGVINNCSSPMCQTPTSTITTPSATTTIPSLTVTTPTATITTPTAIVAAPSATVTTIIAP